MILPRDAKSFQISWLTKMFNHLSKIRPDLAERVRGTDKDPSYVDWLNDPRWDRFVQFIESEWYKE